MKINAQLLKLLRLSEWEKRAKRPGFQSVMSTLWTPKECEEETRRLKRALFSFLGNSNNGVVLDVGCGIGRFTGDLAKRAKQVYAIDISPSMLKRAKSAVKSSNVHFFRESASDLPFSDNYFDLIFEATVLQHITDEKIFKNTVQELKRVANSKGSIFLCGNMRPKHRKLSPLTVHRTVDEYKSALEPWKLFKTKKHLVVDYPYLLTLWKKDR